MSEYQGWTNRETWCVAAFLNNSKVHQDRALDAVDGIVEPFGASVLQTICDNLQKEIVEFADWCWPKGYQMSQVDWPELEKHFRQKLRECRPQSPASEVNSEK